MPLHIQPTSLIFIFWISQFMNYELFLFLCFNFIENPYINEACQNNIEPQKNPKQKKLEENKIMALKKN